MDKWEWIARHEIQPQRLEDLERKWRHKIEAENDQAEVEALRIEQMTGGPLPDNNFFDDPQ